jgi:MFS family permease
VTRRFGLPSGYLVPPQGPIRSVAAAGLVNSFGDGAFAAVSVIYLVRFVGLSATQVGVGLAIAGVVALLVGIPIGMLGDRIGPRPVFAGLCLAQGRAVGAYCVVADWWSFLAAASLAIAAMRGTAGVRNGFIAHLTTGAERLRVRAYLRSVSNTGTALGAGLGGLVLLQPSEFLLRVVLISDSLTFVAAAVLIGTVRGRPPVTDAKPEPLGKVVRNRAFVAASLSQGLLSVNTTLLTVALPLWIATRHLVPDATIGLLLGGSTVIGILLQVPVSRFADTPRGAVRSSAGAGLFLAAACLIYMTTTVTAPAASLALLCVGSAVRLFGELLQVSGGWAMSFSAPPPGRECTYQAVYSTAFTIAAAIGPLLSGWIATQPDGRGWMSAAGLFLVGGAGAALSSAAVFRRRGGLSPAGPSISAPGALIEPSAPRLTPRNGDAAQRIGAPGTSRRHPVE